MGALSPGRSAVYSRTARRRIDNWIQTLPSHCYFDKKKTLAQVRRALPGTGHYEPTRSKACEGYVWKEDTRCGDQFELGIKVILPKISLLTGIKKLIGMMLGRRRRPGTSNHYQVTYIFDIMATCKELEQNSLRLEALKERATSFGVKLGSVNLTEHGKKPERMHILKIQEANFGVAIELIKMLSWTNFAVVSTSHICLDGSISIQCTWRLRVPRYLSWLKQSGSHPTLNRRPGTPMLTTPQ